MLKPIGLYYKRPSGLAQEKSITQRRRENPKSREGVLCGLWFPSVFSV